MKQTKISIFVLVFLVTSRSHCAQSFADQHKQLPEVPEITVNDFFEFREKVKEIVQERVGSRRYGMRFPIIVNELNPIGEGYIKFRYNIRTSYNHKTGRIDVFYTIKGVER